jgi:hypothetical protein
MSAAQGNSLSSHITPSNQFSFDVMPSKTIQNLVQDAAEWNWTVLSRPRSKESRSNRKFRVLMLKSLCADLIQ